MSIAPDGTEVFVTPKKAEGPLTEVLETAAPVSDTPVFDPQPTSRASALCDAAIALALGSPI